ncbi:hypothetical protein [Arthrobacter sp. StoSoilB13]|uniref:hypothetical protein n=1 Tax=Arthrobacter sp. StoSoilB13 TaxID=2830993 RepID=UPI001CC6F575|nr:hypothetical protein [Arthrobacter sp. StoSoilB13]BCW47852.1 hypothetical protein StoSoilB13_01940 [Arthrobacter sp. StoSoilB13]
MDLAYGWSEHPPHWIQALASAPTSFRAALRQAGPAPTAARERGFELPPSGRRLPAQRERMQLGVGAGHFGLDLPVLNAGDVPGADSYAVQASGARVTAVSFLLLLPVRRL